MIHLNLPKVEHFVWNMSLKSIAMTRGRSRAEVQQAIRVKEAAVKRLIHKFSSDNMTEEEIEWCLYSIGW